MDDQSHLDYSTEGTAPVFDSQPVGDVTPVVNTPEPEPILLPAPGPGPSKPPVSKRMKILLGLFSAVILVSGLATSLFLVKQKQNINSRAMPNTCTWETCGDDPAKWAAGAYDEKRIEHLGENPNADAALLNTLNATLDSNSTQKQDVINDFKSTVATVVNNANNGGDKSNITEINKFLNTTNTSTTINSKDGIPIPVSGLSADEIQLFSQVTNTVTTNPQTNTGTTPQTPAIGGKPLTDTVMGQSIDNACNYDKKCTKYSDWQEGWDWARHKAEYLNKNLVPKQTEYTDVAKDLDPNTPLHQVGTIEKDSSGKLVITQVFSVTSNSGGCADTNESCWVTELNKTGYNFSIAPVGKMVDGKIVYNQPVSGTATSTKPISQSWYDLYNQKCKNANPGDTTCCGTGNIQCGGPGSGVDGFCVVGGYAAGQTKGCNNYIADAGLNIKTGGFCAKNTTDANGNKICSTYTNGSLISQELSGFVKVTNDSCIESLGSDVLINAYVCDGMKYSDNPKGCNYPTPTESKSGTGAKLCFDNIKSSGCGVVQIDADTQTKHYSINLFDQSKCNVPGQPTQPTTPTGGGGDNPPTTTTTFSGPTPTPTTPNPQLACYQLQIFRGGTQIQPWQINQGDALIFRGFASVSGGATVSKMRFTVTVGGVAQTPVDVNATLVGGLYQADYNYTITQNTSYSVTTLPI